MQVGALEGRLGKGTDLSVQNLIDCDKDDFACSGGFMGSAFGFVQKQGGVEDEATYPYEGKVGQCRFQRESAVIANDMWGVMQEGDEDLLKRVVAKIGPVAAAIDASDSLFRFYKKGVYNNNKCKVGADHLNHAVLIVGYGTDQEAGDFWIVVSIYFSACNLSNNISSRQLT